MKHPLEYSRQLYVVSGLDSKPNPTDPDYSAAPEQCNDEATANLVGSTSIYDPRLHYPLFDVDERIIEVVPSRSGRGQHVYIQKAIRWSDYTLLIKAMAVAGICDRNWADACINEQVGVLRRPKPQPNQTVEQVLALRP